LAADVKSVSSRGWNALESQQKLSRPQSSCHFAGVVLQNLMDVGAELAGLRQSMIRKSAKRFSFATNAVRVCAEIMLKQEPEAR
jgi:hypothetical protein